VLLGFWLATRFSIRNTQGLQNLEFDHSQDRSRWIRRKTELCSTVVESTVRICAGLPINQRIPWVYLFAAPLGSRQLPKYQHYLSSTVEPVGSHLFRALSSYTLRSIVPCHLKAQRVYFKKEEQNSSLPYPFLFFYIMLSCLHWCAQVAEKGFVIIISFYHLKSAEPDTFSLILLLSKEGKVIQLRTAPATRGLRGISPFPSNGNSPFKVCCSAISRFLLFQRF
jgi:hypothetical protein